MIRGMYLKGNLKFGSHKTIDCTVKLTVKHLDDDEWADPDPAVNSDDYIDGVRISGELFFETWPIDPDGKHPIQPNNIGEIYLKDGDFSTKMLILIAERGKTDDVIPGKVKRYFWNFFPVGAPIWDNLDIFPKNYTGIKMNRVFLCTNFRGFWPNEVSSLVVASDRREAKVLLDAELKKLGIFADDYYTFSEVDLGKKSAQVLHEGNG